MVKVLVLSGYGINCEEETAYCFEKAGAQADIVHVNDLVLGKKKINDYDIMMFPGGFASGDDTGSGNAYANKMKNNLWKDIKKFISDGKVVFGVCNGFQIMVRLGLFPLPGQEHGEINCALLANDSNRYEARWVSLKNQNPDCSFTKNIDITAMPVEHGEGRFYCDSETLRKFEESGQVIFTYCNEDGTDANGVFPANPNGSLADVAGVCDHTGKIMGMMPHPERAFFGSSHPLFTLNKEVARRHNKEIPQFIDSNFNIFKNIVEFARG